MISPHKNSCFINAVHKMSFAPNVQYPAMEFHLADKYILEKFETNSVLEQTVDIFESTNNTLANRDVHIHRVKPVA